MSRKLILLALAALPALAFAPAPFPRPERRPAEDDLAKIQGTWARVLYNERPTTGVVVVKGDVWRANIPADAWIIKLDASKWPRRIDLVSVNNKNSFFRGIYRLEGDTFSYSVRYRASEEDRARDFDAKRAGAAVSVHKRQGP
jgi:uncharacterized protein (TIGR03067 family)